MANKECTYKLNETELNYIINFAKLNKDCTLDEAWEAMILFSSNHIED